MVVIEVDDAVFQKKTKKLLSLMSNTMRRKQVNELLGSVVQKNIIDHFKKERGPHGRWTKLKRTTIGFKKSYKTKSGRGVVASGRQKKMRMRKGVSHKILQDTGKLSNIMVNATSDGALIGTTAKYGKIHNTGGTINRPGFSVKKAKSLHWFNAGGGSNFAKSVGPAKIRIPKREWLYVNSSGKERLMKTLKDVYVVLGHKSKFDVS